MTLYVISTTTTTPLDELDEDDTATLFWNNNTGFGSLMNATVFTEEEAQNYDLPIAADQPIWTELPNGGRSVTGKLENALEDWAVHEPGMWENDQGPEGWWAVSNDHEAIVAYFAKPRDAYRWRMDMINKDLNP